MAEAQDEEEIEAKENKGGEQQQQQNNLEKSSSSSFLWRGLRLGKRVAIAGAAIVAVPAVIPTIVVGVAFAFPFGAYMAGFALTDRVMRSLLSTSSSEIGILEDGNEKGVLKKETEAEEVKEIFSFDQDDLVTEEIFILDCRAEIKSQALYIGNMHANSYKRRLAILKNGRAVALDRDEPTQLAAEQEIDMWPPTTNSIILIEEEHDFVGIGTGKEKHAEERDEPTPLAAEQKNDMWPPTTNSNFLAEEGNGFGRFGTGGEGHAEEKDEPSLWTAEEKVDMWSPTTNLDILTEKGDDFVGTAIGKESHAEGVTDGKQEIYDPEQETKMKFKHTSSIEDKEDIIADTEMKNEVRQIQAERGVEENEERRERGKNDKQNSNEELKLWSSDNSPNGKDYVERGFVNMKGRDKPFEVIGKGEKKKTNGEMEIQGLAAAVLEVKQYPAYPSTMPEGINNETDQIILSSECPAAIKKRDITRIEEVQQPEMFVERRSGGTEDMVQDANEERVNENDGIELIQSSNIFESAIEQPSPEENMYKEGVETIGLTAASKITNEEVPSESYTVDGISIPIPNVEDSSVCYSFVSAAPLECENQMATLNLSKEYASPSRYLTSDVTDVENGPAHTFVETLGALHFNDEVPNGQDDVEREGHPLVQNQIDLSPNEEGKNVDGMRISEERRIEGLSGRELYSSDAEQDTRMKFEYASSISYDDVTPDLGMVQEEREHRDEMEKVEDEKVKVNEKQRIRNIGNLSSLNDQIQRGHANKEGADIVIELSGDETVDKKKAEEDMEIQGLAAAVPEATTPVADVIPDKVEEMEIQGLTTAVPEAKHRPKTTPFAAVVPDNETERRVLCSTSSSVAEKGNESGTQEVRQPETTLDGGAGRTEDEVHDLPPANTGTVEFVPTVHHSLDAVPEECEIDFELASSAVTNREAEDKTVKEANEENVIGQEGMELKQRNDVIASIVHVECRSVVEQLAIEQNLNDPNAEDGSSDITYNIEEANDSSVAAIPLESEREMTPSSSLSTEYASAVEDQSSCVTDAKSEPSVTGVETGEMVHFHDEVSYSDETTWEQIYALRTIVGHKAALHSSLVEELKALYLVTGVEPPISLNDTSDIMEITDKLMFLKFVVGVE